MKKTLTFFIVLIHSILFSQNFNLQRSWGTYFGTSYTRNFSQIDTDGNLYICTTYDPTYSITPAITSNCHQPFLAGNSDIYIAKINSSGAVVWGTYFGGSNGEQVLGMAIDHNNDLILFGSTSSTDNIADTNAYSPTIDSSSNDLFLTKFSPNGSKIWGTYLSMGVSLTQLSNSMASIVCDASNNIYFINGTINNNLGTAGTFQPTKSGTNTSIISKFNADGTKAWSTYYGINGSIPISIGVNNTGIYVTGMTNDCLPSPYNTYFATPNSLQSAPLSCNNSYLSKFDFDGQRVWSTYLGGAFNASLNKIYVKGVENDIYVYGRSQYPNVTSTDAFQTTFSDFFLMKFNDSCQKLWGTFIGTNSIDPSNTSNKININFDTTGNIYCSGTTLLQDNIATSDAYQTTISSVNTDTFAVKFTPNGQRLWGTYYGGTLGDSAEIKPTNDGSFYLVGSTQSTDNIATASSFQPNYINYNSNNFPNLFIARFTPSLSTNEYEISRVKLFPNPNDGTFTITANQEISSIELFDMVGKKVFEKEITNDQEIQTKNLAKGIYFAKIKAKESTFKIEKIIVQ